MFSVNWVTHRHENEPVEIEDAIDEDLDAIVLFCRNKLPSARLKYPQGPPDGFIVFDEAGTEVRRWFDAATPPLSKVKAKASFDLHRLISSVAGVKVGIKLRKGQSLFIQDGL